MTATPPPISPAASAAPPAGSAGAELRRAKAIALRRRLSVFAVLAAVVGIVVAGAAVVGVRQGWLTYALGRGALFGLMAPGLALLAVVLGVIGLVMALAITPRNGIKRSAFAILVGALTFWGIAQGNAVNRDAPPVHEVATDWRDPIMPSDSLVRARGPGANPLEAAPALHEGPQTGVLGRPVAEVNAKTCPGAVPATLLGTAAHAYARTKEVLLDDKLAIVTDDPQAGRLEATAARGLFGQKDDVIVRVRTDGAGARVDIRSAARDGDTDGGENCKRLTRLRAAIAG